MSSKPSMTKGLAEYIAGKTRFNPDQVPLEGKAETVTDVTLKIQRSSSIKYQMVRESRKGPLPSNIRRADPAHFTQILMEFADKNKAELPQLAQKWLNESGSHFQDVPAGKSFLKYREPIGAEDYCESCGGHGKNQCHHCGGRGETKCRNCNGWGKLNCGVCSGTKQVRCSSCTGGYRMENGRQVQCAMCYGRGYRNCDDCDFAGKVTCRRCGGSGDLVCGGCHGSGSINCQSCDATGLVCEILDLECVVTEKNLMASQGAPDREVDAFIANKVSVNLAARLASMKAAKMDYHGGVIDRLFIGAMPVGTLTFRLNGKDFLIHGYGPQGEVFDYKDLANELLKQDLVNLKRAATYSAIYSPFKLAALFKAAQFFVKSEINALIALAAATDQSLLRSQIKGAMSQAAIDDSWRAINKAFDILLEGCLLLPSIPVWVAAIAATMLAPSYITASTNGILALVFLATAAFGYFVLRSITHYRFSVNFGSMMHDSLAKSNRFKVANRMYITVTLTLLAALYIQDMVPIFQ